MQNESDNELRESVQEQNKRANRAEARLCAILMVLEDQGQLDEILDRLDEKESGIKTIDLMGWWKWHKEQDIARRNREREEVERQQRLAREEEGRILRRALEIMENRAQSKR